MPRRARSFKQKVAPDAKFNNIIVARFTNKVMKKGKKSTAQGILYDAMDKMEKQENKPAVGILEQAIRNATPLLEVKPRRVGGATYQVPVEIRPDRALSLSMRWLIRAARERAGKTMIEKLAAELLDASRGQGAAIRRREETHKMAEANRAFAHFKW
jgi:small subunit ribosomal protein S7